MSVYDRNQLREAKERAKRLLDNETLFNKHFEETFKKYDANGDGTIGLAEYVDFLSDILTSSGRRNYKLSVASLKFDHADIDGDGQIEKDEFKKELKKRLNEIMRL
jgi:Ca2+-binding EF-hand superfamily protein